MVQFTFDSMFRTTHKGLPDTQNLTPYTYLSMNHFVYSLIVEIIIGLVVTGYAGMSVYRAFYKIKNEKFFPAGAGEEKPEEEETKSKSDAEGDENTNDNLIYRFDEDDQKEKEEDKEAEQEEEEENQNEEQTVSQQTTEWFLDLDHKLLYLQCFLIPFAVVVNVFATNVLVVILLGVALVLFFLFNIKQMCSKTVVLQLLFCLPCIAALLMVFFEDRDMST